MSDGARPALLDAAGQVALIAGAAGGIGRPSVELFRRAGAAVAGFDRAPAGADCDIVGDACSDADVSAAVETTLSRFGRIDHVIALVGATGAGPLDEVSLAEWRRLLDVNLTSSFLLARAAHRALKASAGSLVLMSSTNGRHGGSSVSGPAYGAAKAGIINLTRYLAKEWAGDRIRVNCVAPGPVATPMLDRLDTATRETLRNAIPLGRFADPLEVAGVLAFLCSTHAASITGACINVSGGLVLD